VSLYRFVAVLLLTFSVSAAAAADKPGCADHPLFPSRMPDYSIERCEVKDFDGYDFNVQKGPKHREEGKFTFLTYALDTGKKEQSGVAVVRNYANAITKIGGEVVATDPERWVVGKMTLGGREVWVQADKGNAKIWIRILEKKPMEQRIVADAASFGNDLKATGRTAVYGIYFDTGKAELKPESTPALQEVAKLFTGDASLKLFVVGHTDSVGNVDANMKLAQARAEAVVAALTTTHGIAAARLKGYGVGPLCPVASNDAEDGRAKNRRVELVKQ